MLYCVQGSHSHSLYLIYALSLVAITRFLGGTFGQNLVGGGKKTFYTAGDPLSYFGCFFWHMGMGVKPMCKRLCCRSFIILEAI